MRKTIKYDYEFKVRCVEEVLKNNLSTTSVARSNKISKFNLRLWISFYLSRGIGSLRLKANQQYTAEFKLNVIETISKNKLSLIEACVQFNIPSASCISIWQGKFNKFGIIGLENKTRGRPKKMNFKRKKRKSDKPLTREEELLLEIESLRAENELLKKFNALVQAEEAKLNKRRKP
jgi:transposase